MKHRKKSQLDLESYIEKVKAKPIPKTIRLPEELWTRIEKLSKSHGISLNQLIALVMSLECKNWDES